MEDWDLFPFDALPQGFLVKIRSPHTRAFFGGFVKESPLDNSSMRIFLYQPIHGNLLNGRGWRDLVTVLRELESDPERTYAVTYEILTRSLAEDEGWHEMVITQPELDVFIVRPVVVK